MRVLIVSNDRALLRHLSRFLATFGYKTNQVANYQRAAEIARANWADLLLVDGESDFESAIALCRAVWEEGRSNGHYALLMIGRQSQSRLLEAIEVGVDDFLAKPIVYGEVLMRLRAGARAVEFQRRMHEQRRREPITELLTCAAFRARLEAAEASASGALACASIEIDFIERVARRFGVQAQRDLLCEVGRFLTGLCTHDQSKLAHFGNGRFAVLLPGMTAEAAAQWGESVRDKIAGTEFHVGETKLALTASVGIDGREEPGVSITTVFERSEQALNAAKASGGDCVVEPAQFAEEEAAWKELAAPGRLFERTVARDVMLPCTVTLRDNDSIRFAESLFEQTQLNCVVIVNDNERLAGVLLEEDLAEYLQALGEPTEQISKIMLRDVKAVEESAPFADLMKYFAEGDGEMLVVVDKDRPTGLVSAASLASLSRAPKPLALCSETPSIRSSYLQIVERQPATDTA